MVVFRLRFSSASRRRWASLAGGGGPIGLLPGTGGISAGLGPGSVLRPLAAASLGPLLCTSGLRTLGAAALGAGPGLGTLGPGDGGRSPAGGLGHRLPAGPGASP